MTEWLIELGPKPTDGKVRHNGTVVSNVRSVEVYMTAGELPIAKIEIVAPYVRAYVAEGNVETTTVNIDAGESDDK